VRLSPDHYPSHIEFYCSTCDEDKPETAVDSIESDDVVVICPQCNESTYVRVIE